MTYSEFCKEIYGDKGYGKSCALKLTSQSSMAEFFFKIVFPFDHDLLPKTPGAYDKWFSGENSPVNNLWELVVKDLKENKMAEEINDNIVETRLRDALLRFGIEINSDDKADVNAFAWAITMQFKKIAEGNGTADDIVNELYHERLEQKNKSILFPQLLRRLILNELKYEFILACGADVAKFMDTVIKEHDNKVENDILSCVNYAPEEWEPQHLIDWLKVLNFSDEGFKFFVEQCFDPTLKDMHDSQGKLFDQLVNKIDSYLRHDYLCLEKVDNYGALNVYKIKSI
jgi:hypothetical protein